MVSTKLVPAKKKPVLSDDTLQKISSAYGFKIIKADSFRTIWRLTTDAGYKYLKRSKLTPIDLQFIYEALEYLAGRAFELSPRFTLSRSGCPYVTDESGPFIITDWYFSQELDFGILMDLKQAASLLAEFHQKSLGFMPSRVNYHRAAWWSWPAKFEGRIEQLQDFRRMALSEKENSAFCRLYLRHFELYYREAWNSYEMLLRSPYAEVAAVDSGRKSFCHHDYSGRNLLRTYEDRLILVDFDYCLSDIRIHDLINLLVRNLKHTGWNSSLAGFILKEYHHTGELTREELEVMHVLLHWPQDFWQVGLQYFYEKLSWPRERFLKKLESKVDNRFNRERFLKEFPEQNGIYVWKYA
jgi:CotS family spore coat protein